MDIRGRSISPNSILAACAALFVFLGLGSCGGGPEEPVDAPHIFLIIGDGMGRSSEIIASRYLGGLDDGLAWSGFPVRAWLTTWDVDTYDAHAAAEGAEAYAPDGFDPRLGYDPSIGGGEPWGGGAEDGAVSAYLLGAATDSAAAATAMATGRKTNRGRLSWAPGVPASADGALAGIVDAMVAEGGASIGIVSTMPFDHATPAAFLAGSPSRTDYDGISSSIISLRKPMVVIGGGHPSWCPGYLGQGTLASLRGDPGWLLLERQTGSEALPFLVQASLALPRGASLFALYGDADGAFAARLPVDEPGQPSLPRHLEEPTLAEALVIAAELVTRNGGPSFVMAEAGDVDWANHANDLPRMIGAVVAMDEAVRALLEFIDRPGDQVDRSNSLVMVTADHATGLPRFDDAGGMGKGSLPIRVTELPPHSWEYREGTTVSYLTGGHGNELVGFALACDDAESLAEPHVLHRSEKGDIMDNTAVYGIMRSFLARWR